MSPIYLFQGSPDTDLARYVNPETVFAFDLDGPLAPLFKPPPIPAPAEVVRQALHRLAKLAKVIVITGRPAREAESALGFKPHLAIGRNGIEWYHPHTNALLDIHFRLREQLYPLLCHLQGIQIELDGESVLVHFANAWELSRIEAAIAGLDPPPEMKIGRCLIKFAPVTPFSKGAAVAAAVEKIGCTEALYFEDEGNHDVHRWPHKPSPGGEKDGFTAVITTEEGLLPTLNRVIAILEMPNHEAERDPLLHRKASKGKTDGEC